MTGSWEALFTASEIRAAEATYSGSSLDLMERAGRSCAEAAVARFPGIGRWGVHCGGGSNGGDGLVVARHLRRLGRDVELVLRCDANRYSGNAAENFRRCRELAINPVETPTATDGVVDALLGTGFVGEPRSDAGAAIDDINRRDCPVVSVDVPSGVDASSGEIGTRAVQAELTVSFHARKLGHMVAPGSLFSGEVIVADIGLDSAQAATSEAANGRICPGIVARIGARAAGDNKYTAGSVVVVGGSPGLTGAPALTARAALRAGAGVVVECVPASLRAVFEAQSLEVMTRSCADLDGVLNMEALPIIAAAASKAGAVAIGPGLGRSDAARDLVEALMDELTQPIVLDADGLWALGENLESVRSRTSPTVLTPHAGELGRLLGRPSSWVDAHRLTAVTEAAARADAVVVLKGADTLVAGAENGVLVSDLGTPGLATAGSGDVLTGIVAAALSRRLGPLDAAAVGVAIAGLAARRAGAQVGMPGLIASDVVAAIPAIVAGAQGLPGPMSSGVLNPDPAARSLR